jgi:DNA primase
MDAIRRSGQAILVEGNFDVLALHDAGIAEAVAPMGTALTVEQIAAVGRLSQRVIVIFDGDEAGQRAARKAVPLFVEADVDGRVGRLPRGVDPDELVRKEGAEVFRKLVATARPMVDQLIDDLCREARDESVPEHVNVLEQVAPVLAALQNPAARNLYEGRLAQTLKIDLRQVRRAIDAARAGRRVSSPEAGVAAAPRAPRDVAKRVPPKEELWPLALLVTHSSVAKLPESRQVFDLLTDPAVRGLYRVALETFEGNGHLDVPAWLDGGAEDVREAVSETLMEGRFDNAEAAERTMKSLLVTLQKARIDAEISFLNKRLSELRGSGNVEELRAIQLRAVELKRTKDQLRP